ncbi:hypothetical protein COCSUDRAFT_49062 [Coccomyxa subellipsoidea C-169]|uniref:EF-hand domain-containing protein n=1 Tax=Coccomyxa subellipsoidea (strain C-169) TaxID=574566 RepID=I0YLG6_COCSC|nr:hypothetical protein COCSUDRAFT_49062 [Coccomyxa subellipsoidea C-169]EIE19235.1 hypothetical protein COCSUDRAFT_49062 [Coccomyxa subellipsoidea C-169]|eukprot:XP_005643779.1 hypothetical protein COCSUDRAFT_49062 [Coccomyxa subellipsoidea C-169]
MQNAYGSQQPAAYGYSVGGQSAAGSGAVAQAAQGLAPEQQAKLSQIVAQETQQAYGTGTYASQQGTATASYGTAQPASGYGTVQQASAYSAQQPQQQPAVGYGTAQGAAAGGYGTQQTTPAYAGQSNVGQGQYASHASPAPAQGYSAQQPTAPAAYGQTAPARTGYTAPQQTTPAGYTYGSSYGSQATPAAGAATYGQQQPAAQQGSYAATGQQSQYKPAAGGPKYGTPGLLAASGRRCKHIALLCSRTWEGALQLLLQAPPAARGAPAHAQANRAAAAAQVGQSAREIARMADAAREKRDEAKARERERDRPRESRITATATATAERPRGRDRERDSEAKERDAPRSRSRLTSPPHRSPRRPSPVRRKEPDYAVRLSSRPLVTLERDYHEVIHRCTRLYVSADFSKVASTWVKAQPVAATGRKSVLWRLFEPVHFQHEVDYEESPMPDLKPVSLAEGAVKWNARVVLLSGLDDDARKELLKGVHHGGQHLHQLLKFLTVRTETDKDDGRVERSGITAIGGQHDPSLDGPITDASKSTEPLIATCVRHAKKLLGVDLSACKEWLPVIEVHYQRPPSSLSPDATESTEITVIFLAIARRVMPEDWQSTWKEQEAWLKGKAAREEAVTKKEEEEKASKAKAVEEKAKPEEATKAEGAAVKDDEPAGAEKPAKRAKTGDVEEEKKKDHGKVVDTDIKDADNKAPEAPQEAETDAKVPEVPRLLFRGKRSAKERWRSASISLDGLLDYDEEDRDESTMELSLFAEGFQEMLARDYGERILKSLYAERSAALKRREERKRKREEEKAAAEAKEKAAEEAKQAEPEAAAVKEEDEIAAPVKEESQNGRPVLEAADTEMKEAAAEEVAPVKAEGGEEGEAAGAVEGDAKEEEELAEGEGSPDKGAGCGKKGRTTRGRGRGRAARGRGRKAQAKAGGNAEAEADEPGENGGKSEGEEAAQETPDKAAPTDKTAAVDVQAEGTAKEEGGGKAAGVQDTAAEPAKEDQPKEAKAPAEKPVENGSAKVEKHEEGASGDKDKEKKKKKYKVDEELLLAFRYFDRNCCGYIKVDDLRRIVANLGHALSLRTVKELCLNVAGAPSSSAGRARQDRIYYRDITDREVTDGS